MLRPFCVAVSALGLFSLLLAARTQSSRERLLPSQPAAKAAFNAEQYVLSLYGQHENGLRRLRDSLETGQLHTIYSPQAKHGHPKGMLYDLESETLYLSVRSHKPVRILEIGAAYGLSTSIMLMALIDNQPQAGAGQRQVSELHSVDINDYSLQDVPASLRSSPFVRWCMHRGDLLDVLSDPSFPPLSSFDFIFIDALHTLEFARLWGQHVLSNARRTTPVPTFVHDIYTFGDLSIPTPEAVGLFEWAAFSGRMADAFTLSPHRELGLRRAVENFRQVRLGWDPKAYYTPASRTLGGSDAGIFFMLMPPDHGSVPRLFTNAVDERKCPVEQDTCLAVHGLELVCVGRGECPPERTLPPVAHSCFGGAG